MRMKLLNVVYQSLFITCGNSKEICVPLCSGSSEPLSALWGMREMFVRMKLLDVASAGSCQNGECAM